MRDVWSDTPSITFVRYHCKGCLSVRAPKIIRTHYENDGSCTQKVWCKDCGLQFRRILDMPDRPEVEPSAEDIQAAAERMRATWTEEQRLARADMTKTWQ